MVHTSCTFSPSTSSAHRSPVLTSSLISLQVCQQQKPGLSESWWAQLRCELCLIKTCHLEVSERAFNLCSFHLSVHSLRASQGSTLKGEPAACGQSGPPVVLQHLWAARGHTHTLPLQNQRGTIVPTPVHPLLGKQPGVCKTPGVWASLHSCPQRDTLLSYRMGWHIPWSPSPCWWLRIIVTRSPSSSELSTPILPFQRDCRHLHSAGHLRFCLGPAIQWGQVLGHAVSSWIFRKSWREDAGAELRRSNAQKQPEVSGRPAWRAWAVGERREVTSQPSGERLAAGKAERRLGGDHVEVLAGQMLL